jgi:hypothetical protein
VTVRDVSYPVVADPALNWLPCGWRDDKHQVVATYGRDRLSAGLAYLPGGTSTLDCGTADKFGYHHIVQEHLGEWEQMAAITRENRREAADDAITWTLRDPDSGRYNPTKDTFCYERKVFLVDKRTGRQAGDRSMSVVVASPSKNIITSFPGPCPGA